MAATAAAKVKQVGHDVPAPSDALDPPGAPWLPLAAGALMFLVVWLLVAGSQPRWFTKWGWFWIVALLPVGIVQTRIAHHSKAHPIRGRVGEDLGVIKKSVEYEPAAAINPLQGLIIEVMQQSDQQSP